MRATSRAATTALAIAVVTALAACSGGGGDDDNDETAAGGDSAAACGPAGDERPARAILRCSEASVAFVETLYATGTGVAVEVDGKDYVVTNQHVVDPFDAADVTIAGRTLTDVPVVGADVAADIALLGPVANDLAALPIGAAGDLERGDDVYLVGFPGESGSDEHEATIASGIVSRLRNAEEWEQRYVQTDASIAGGQSGGALFDAHGRVVGISGLSFADEFALALSGEDVREAISRITGGDGDDILTLPAVLPARGGATSGTVKLDSASDVQLLFLPPSDTKRTWHLTVTGADANVSVEVDDAATAQPLAINAATVTQLEAFRARLKERGVSEVPGDFEALIPALTDEMRAREPAPGSFAIELDEYQAAEVYVSASTDTAIDVPWTSDQELWPGSLPVAVQTLELGETYEEIFNSFDTSLDYLVELEAGQRVEVSARTPQGDVDVDVIPPSVIFDAVAAYDPEAAGVEFLVDSDAGLYGLDVLEEFTAEESGTYRFKVYSVDLATTAIRFSIDDA